MLPRIVMIRPLLDLAYHMENVFVIDFYLTFALVFEDGKEK